jgi:hypothetical protein
MSIRIKPSHKGLLHRDLGVPQGEPIPKSKIKAAEQSADPALRKRARFADNASHFEHDGHTASVVPRHHRSSAYRK